MGSAMLWLALHLPALPIEVYTRGLPPDTEPAAGRIPASPSLPTLARSDTGPSPQVRPAQPPLAVSERERIIARDAAAARLGIVPGLPEAAARALAAQLRILPRRPAAERAALARLGAWALAFSHQVSLDPPAALVLEAGRSLKLFGGAEALRRQVLDGATRLGWRARCVLAPTPAAALALAASGLGGLDAQAEATLITDRDALRRVLARLPVAALGFSPTELDDLQRMGLVQLGELLRLPRAGLAERFGVARLHQLERLLGERPDPRAPFTPPQRFRASLELPAEVPDAAALIFACRRLIDELGSVLAARQAGVQHLAWQLHHADGPPTRFRLGSAAPSRDPEHWLALLRERLERLRLTAPVRAVAVSSEPLRPLAPRNAALLPRDPAVAAPDPALLDRLRARLGSAAVQGLTTAPDHRPERAWRLREPLLPTVVEGKQSGQHAGGGAQRREAAPSVIRDVPLPEVRHDRPLWLLAEPTALAVHDGHPWLDGPLDLGSGCERIDTGWWDGYPVARDYYVAVTADGERLWVFRELRGGGGWFLHGLFGDDPRAQWPAHCADHS
jgi:protein ImuB